MRCATWRRRWGRGCKGPDNGAPDSTGGLSCQICRFTMDVTTDTIPTTRPVWPVGLRNTFYLKEVSMLRKLMFVAAMALLPAAAANAQFQAGDWELTLGANAAHGPDLNGVNFSGNGAIGYFLTK